MARVDYDRMAAVYDAGRDRTLDQRQAWREALGRHLPPPCGCAGGVLDLGAGTGQWARALTTWLEFFPAAERVLATFPRLVDTVVLFERAGFTLVGMRAVADLAAASLADALERVRLRADTVLRHLPDAEFHAGLRRLEAAVAAEDPARPAGPIFGQIPLVVLAK
jgi:SAM-dependent methyltransferase